MEQKILFLDSMGGAIPSSRGQDRVCFNFIACRILPGTERNIWGRKIQNRRCCRNNSFTLFIVRYILFLYYFRMENGYESAPLSRQCFYTMILCSRAFLNAHRGDAGAAAACKWKRVNVADNSVRRSLRSISLEFVYYLLQRSAILLPSLAKPDGSSSTFLGRCLSCCLSAPAQLPCLSWCSVQISRLSCAFWCARFDVPCTCTKSAGVTPLSSVVMFRRVTPLSCALWCSVVLHSFLAHCDVPSRYTAFLRVLMFRAYVERSVTPTAWSQATFCTFWCSAALHRFLMRVLMCLHDRDGNMGTAYWLRQAGSER